ncbi:MAG: HAMP domain-containing sensor histidine kinase [Planctomycetota bacterium]
MTLWRAVRSMEAEARSEAARGAMLTARALRDWLSSPDGLASFDRRWQFSLDEGAIAIPEELGWVITPPKEAPEQVIPPSVLDLLDRARLLEFGEKDGAGATALYDEILTSAALTPPHGSWLVLAAAWHAQRQSDTERRDRLLAELDTEPETSYRATIAGALLLNAIARRPLPSWTEQRLGRLTLEQGEALLLRLREAAVPALLRDRIARAIDEAAIRRDVLRRVARLAPTLSETVTTVAQTVAESTLLYFPETQGRGRGVLLPTGELLRIASDWLRSSFADRMPWAGQLVAGTPPADRVPIIASLAVVPQPVEGAAALSRPWALSALLITLSGVLVFGLIHVGRAVRRERDAVQARAGFLTSVTHEIKTPLASIRLLTEMLSGGRAPTAEKQREYVRNLTAETGRLSVLIENVLDLGRMERGERSYDRRVLSADDVLREAVALFEPLGEAEGLRVQLEARGSDALLLADRGALLQVFLNVLENARRYAASGGKLYVGALNTNDSWQVRFRDWGPGVPIEERTLIFEKFRRGGSAARSGNPGVGLGLYLARRLLQAQGGDLTCEDPSDGGPGTQFTVRLPLHIARRGDEPEAADRRG